MASSLVVMSEEMRPSPHFFDWMKKLGILPSLDEGTLLPNFGSNKLIELTTITKGIFHKYGEPNTGLHPTADTTALKFLQWLGAAGDAGRYLAS